MGVEETHAASAFQKLHPRAYYQRFLSKNVRPDGRSRSSRRAMRLSCGTISSADGSALANLGHTKVVCGVRYMVGVPSSSAPCDGHVDVRVHLPPLCSSKYEHAAKPGKEAFQLASFLSSVVDDGNVVDNAELCIEEAKAVFVLCADVLCVNDDGNLWDAAMLALIAALRNLRLPEVEVGESGEVVERVEGKQRGLTLRHVPMAFTFGMLGEDIIEDPTEEEAQILDAQFTIVVNSQREVCAVRKPEGPGLAPKTLLACVAQAHVSAEEVLRKILEVE